MRYPYTRLGPSIPLRPYLKIVLRNGSATTPLIYGLVDSGADYSIFPSDVAKTYLKLDLSTATPWHFQGTTGRPQIALLAAVEVNILNEAGTANDFQFTANVGFCDDFKFGGGVLLGQNGFMSEFKTTFNQRENFFEIEPFQMALLQRS
jgi:hypothetical protein